MTKAIIYYSDFHASPEILEVCLRQLKSAWTGDAVSVTLNKPLDLGKNIVLQGERSNSMFYKQILTALENSTADYIFFCEHDVLYRPEHFEFTPPKDNVFYYNISSWRWEYPNDRLVTWDEMTPLSSMCVNREWALDHYRRRVKRIIDTGCDKEDGIGKMQPVWARALGYEPGTKRRKIGGFSDDVSDKWKSKVPNIDIRHKGCLTNPKTNLHQFKHPPTNFQERTIKDFLPEWDLKSLFNL